MLKGLSYTDEKVPIMGLLQTSRSGGRIVVYGDSNCLDSAHSEGNCFWLLDMWLEYTGSGLIDPTLSSLLTELETDLSNTGDQLPMRLPNSKFGKYSKVVKSGSAFIRRQLPECFVPSPFVIVPKNGTIEGEHVVYIYIYIVYVLYIIHFGFLFILINPLHYTILYHRL